MGVNYINKTDLFVWHVGGETKKFNIIKSEKRERERESGIIENY